MLKRVKLGSLKPNPYRHFGTYEIQQDKIDALLESIESSGFWGETVIARPAGKGYELAFGHHRWQAAIEHFGEGKMVEISVRDLDNDAMLKMMARENNEVFDAKAQQDIELVKSTLEAYMADEIHLDTSGPHPSNVDDYIDCDEGYQFTAVELSKYLGYVPVGTGGRERANWRITQALGHLKEIRDETVTVDDFKDLTPEVASKMSVEVRKAKKEGGKPLAQKVVKEIKKAVKLGAGKRDIPDVARKAKASQSKAPMPDINDVAKDLAKLFSNVLGDNKDVRRLEEVIKHQKYADQASVYRLKMSLKSLAKIADSYSKKLEAPEVGLDEGVRRKRAGLEVVK